ncbi:HlyD family secretion protein [Nannocystis radixulma]|uniref:HlyD family efflux transporter periplasmic adaptor subunit n=1 Tax=Nannocystis radixulma TaxID=2995305 RepID=A0ABT5B7M8_9BACT|nr:HlyD family efflux transporter periplasmic adaptor subunit [Nannocystis radixulma]MDC0670119.1 HlyD family efflux transporter periplasmic adaptor subunit [Nannocystis radixulma]
MSSYIRTRILPWVVWAGTMAGATWLWLDVRAEGAALGFALGVEHEVKPPAAGRVQTIEVAPGQRVRAGQVVAVLDAGELDAERAILAAERAKLEASLGAVRAETTMAADDKASAAEATIAESDMAVRTARSNREIRAAELRAVSAQFDALAGLVKERMADRRDLDALGVKRAALRKEVEAADTLVPELVRQAAAARARRESLPTDATELALRPVRAELAVIAGREQLLAVRREQTVLRAPADGQVAAVHVPAGAVAGPNAPVLTIVSRGPGDADEVVVCLREGQAGQVRVGEAVLLRSRGAGGPAVTAHVTRLGPQIGELPERCRRNPALPEWGREIAVALDEHAPLLPGQAFSVSFLGYPSPCAPVDVASPPTTDADVLAAPKLEAMLKPTRAAAPEKAEAP